MAYAAVSAAGAAAAGAAANRDLRLKMDFSTMILLFLIGVTTQCAYAQVLTPPYFNLAVGRPIEATATCGVEVSEPELFCKLTGANPDKEDVIGDFGSLIQGQFCDKCDPSDTAKAHAPKHAVDGTERWWQSPPLSRGLQFNEVNLTVHLEQEFHVAYVFIKMGNSPRPGVFALERSTDHGRTWQPWQYFADTPSDCNTFFGHGSYSDRIIRDDSVICTTEYSKVVPLEGGEIVVSLVNNRPSSNNFSYSLSLQEWTKATDIRLRLLRTKTLLGHLMAVARQDPTVTRRYYYSIKDISIGGQCVCNGHADDCDRTDPMDSTKLVCRCQHNTCGQQCDVCCPGFVQKPWRPATLGAINECEPCHCNGHSLECRYDPEVDRNRSSVDVHGRYEGGGVCISCQHNTIGINCDKCRPGFYRPFNVPINSTRACRRCSCDQTFSTGNCLEGSGQCECKPEYAGVACDRCNDGYYGYPRCIPCQCHINGTQGRVCEVGGGQCPCKPNFDGPNCDQCAPDYYNFPECQSCDCDIVGSRGRRCEPKQGQCVCRPNYSGRNCGSCAAGYFNYPACDPCSCDKNGATADVCDKEYGRCTCKENFSGARCERCAPGYFNWPHCIQCGCSEIGMQSNTCDAYGQCDCKRNFQSSKCDQCAPGFYKYPECLECRCDVYGSYGISCDQQTGQCDCVPTFEGLTCNRCRPNYYNYPTCEECSCDPSGAKEVPGYPLGGCGAHAGGQLCECKDRVGGRICDTCKPGFWNLNIHNPDGCEDCGCDTRGTNGGSRVCDVATGQCVCKPFVNSIRCSECADGTYNLQESNVFGCQACNCDVGGSLDQNCDKTTGQCNCKPRVNGKKCENPIATHYFPTLYHMQYELEDGHTPSGGAVRYGFDARTFPDFSWKGYAIFSKIQDEVVVDVDIRKPSLYRIIYRYVNPSGQSVSAEVTASPDSSSDTQQTNPVTFPSAYRPEFVTVSSSGVSSAFVLNPGRWSISLKTSESLFVDYLVLLPQAYYEATILQEKVHIPCGLPSSGEICKYFVYVDVNTYPSARGETGVTRVGGTERTQLYPDRNIPDKLGVSDLAYLNNRQITLTLNLPVRTPGKYIFIIKYYSQTTGRLQELDVDVVSSGGRDRGSLRLPGCPYSSLCRQAVIDSYGNPKEFTIDGVYATITITGRPDIDLAVDSIVAIPVNDWKIDLISPQLRCVRKDEQCVPGTYITPAGTVRVDFESGNEHRIATDTPPYIIDTTIKVIKLDGSAPTVDVKAIVTNAGKYVLVGHYYQPYIAGFDIDVYVNTFGQTYKGTFETSYCPSVSGCRSVIIFKDADDMKTIDLSDPNIRITFNSSRPIWLDYLMVIPSVQFNPKTVLNVQDVDKSSEFITKCGSHEFAINTTDPSHCRDAVFSLTTEYNNGALQCQCNGEGSLSYTCSEFGGQCRCKPNIIGRTCSNCRTGYYGFPNCRRCACPSGLCDPISGQCVCPPRVTGASCDTCLPRTFGFDPLIGCEDCNCEQRGVVGGRTDCEVDSGQCQCKPSITGRRCNKCHAGYYGFPRCRECSCDRNGVTSDICDQRSATCLCKSNVDGPQCSQCKAGTFYLEERNPKGCTQCFCFGITTRCDSSNYRWSQIVSMDGWGVTNLQDPSLRKSGDQLDASNIYMVDEDESVYWIAPSPYLGNHVTSYGGKLTYTVLFNLPRGDRSSRGVIHADVRVEGHDFVINHVAREQPVPGVPLTVEVDLLETKFEHDSSGAPVTREQFMLVLSRIRALHIRGSYYSAVDNIQLSDVQLGVASESGRGAEAPNVEQCQCPPNYSGTSCEQCAPGYYRSKQGPYLGACVPCQCNDRANVCDPDSGECQNCRDNFHGPQCLACKRGYYLDGYTNKCEICGCPLEADSNNFAATCQVSSSGRVDRCDCIPGYTGTKCERCDVGYWGNPMRIGGSCKPCECSGNIDLQNPRSCEVETGRCVECLHYTGGDRCERCRDWYYGDAIGQKNCRACVCNTIGSELCDHQSGACLCKPNVVGATCDRCIPGAYGLESGRGCEMCNCGPASVSSECDIYSGQCQCRPGVTGRNCDKCEPGYWNYGPRGCQSCTCLSSGATTCDPLTGQCQCLPGVTGPNCDQCLPRWIMIPGIGCEECDNCVHLLMDDVEFLDHNVTTIRRELDSVSVGIMAFQRLDRINRTVTELRPQVDNLISRPTDPSQLNPIKRELYEVQTLANDISMKSDRTVRNAELVESDASDVKTRAETISRELVDAAIREANEAVEFVKSILDAITGSIGNSNVDELLRQAERMLAEIKSRDFSDKDNAAKDELEKAVDALRRAKELMDRAMSQANRTIEINIWIEDILTKLQDLQNSSRHSMDNSQAAAAMNNRIRLVMKSVTETILKIRQMQTDVNSCIERARKMLDDARQFLVDASDAYNSLEHESSRLDTATREIQQFVVVLKRENVNLQPLVENATSHALELQRQAELLERLIADTRESAEAALNASNAYRAITDAINSALNASLEAIKVAEEAAHLSSGLADEAKRSRERSERLKSEADVIAEKVNYELRVRLETAKRNLEEVTRINILIKEQLIDIVIGLDNLPDGGFGDKAREAAARAMDAQTKAEAAENKITDIVNRLPEDQRKLAEIPRDIDLANRNVRAAQIEVDQVLRIVPDVISLLDRLSVHSARIRQLGLDLKANISLLRNNVSAARDQANLIRVGVSFRQEDSSLQVRNPKNILTAGAYSRVSLYFRTESDTGLLFFAGPNATQSRWDYMSLQIIGGKAVFKFDLGTGPAIITNPKSVSDGKWHEAIMERTGRMGNLTIRTENEPDEIQGGESEGTSSVLDFDHYTQIFIGGIPDNAVHLREILQYTRYSGCVEDVKFDGVAVGLWNFVTARNLRGCIARDVLQETLVNGYMFGGNGYVILTKDRFTPGKMSIVKLSFRTFSSDGLLLLMGTPGKDFFSLEMKDGRFVFQFDLGSGRATLASTQTFNDGNWHTVVASRVHLDGLLKIDSITASSGRSPGNLKDLDTDNFIYIGGFKGNHTYSNASVTQKGFEGCIKDIRFGSTDRNINEHIEAKDVLPGCPEMENVRVVSFSRGRTNSYIGLDSYTIDATFELSMKFKTLEQDGLLFYASDASQENAFSVSLRNGKVVVMNVPESRVTSLESQKDTYGDGIWHYLTVIKEGKDLSLYINERDFTATKIEGKRSTPTTSSLYFGGIPQTMTILMENVASRTPFVGCIGDVTIRSELINFGRVRQDSMSGVILSNCPLPDPTPPAPIMIVTVPTRQPIVSTDPPDRCQLPLEPLYADVRTEDGYRFGSRPDSRLEYDSLPSRDTNRAEYSVDFKTTSSKGVIFYVANQAHVDFVGIYLHNGYVSAAFNCGGGTARLTSNVLSNDGEWHNLVFTRNQQNGSLTIDGADRGKASAPGTSNSIEVVAPYYVGGLPQNFNVKGSINLYNVSSGFIGCLRNFMQDGRPIGNPSQRKDVGQCDMSSEIGTFFYSNAGHLVLADNFSVGLDLDIMLEIKPRTLSGVLLSVYNSAKGPLGDYLVLQMVDGNVMFTMDNGEGEVTAIYNPPAKNALCNGQWHTVHALKAKNLVTLEVDKVYTSPAYGEPGVVITNTEDPLYVGGVPVRHRGIKTSESYVGCIRRLELGKVMQDFSVARSVGRIDLDSCPTT